MSVCQNTIFSSISQKSLKRTNANTEHQIMSHRKYHNQFSQPMKILHTHVNKALKVNKIDAQVHQNFSIHFFAHCHQGGLFSSCPCL